MTKKQFKDLKVGDKIKIENMVITVDKRRLLKDGYLFLSALYPPKSISKIN